MKRDFAVGLLTGLALALSAVRLPARVLEPQQQFGGGQARTANLVFDYPSGEEARVEVVLLHAEAIYERVDSLMDGALPSPVHVTLVSTGLSGSTSEGIVLSLQQGRHVEPFLARALVNLAGREIVGDVYELEGYRFFVEGLAAWVGEPYEHGLGSLEPRWLRAAYAYMEEATYLEYLEVYSRASEELGKNVVNAVGYTFVAHLIEHHGWAGVTSLLQAMTGNSEICGALDDAGFDCFALWASWQLALEAESARHDFTLLPEILADLEMGGEGETREVSLRVFIRNPETDDYLFFVAYEIDGERVEESFPADSGDFEARVPLGAIPVGTKVLWEVAVWSRTVQAWRRNGWQDGTIR
ncbi:MAG: hypothetical protein AMS21_09690 [Gemmatimonas sp. SG8_38_2]|nr:MAG: hypothetical protein AMS21_09690 [Gemmatimonas sp. SG8_38_2]